MTKPRLTHLSAAAFTLAVAFLGIYSAGCDSCAFEDQCFPECESDDDCDDDRVCAQLSVTPEQKRCTRACTSGADCASCPECRCQCTGGPGSGICELDANDPIDRGVDRLCQADYDRAAACSWLCIYCSCFHGECPGGTTSERCEAECVAAGDAAPACAAQLDAYYFCGHRKGTCGTNPQGYPMFEADITCPDEYQALASCLGASCPLCTWNLFYPTAPAN